MITSISEIQKIISSKYNTDNIIVRDRIYQEVMSIAFVNEEELDIPRKTKSEMVSWAKRCSEFADRVTDRLCEGYQELGFKIV